MIGLILHIYTSKAAAISELAMYWPSKEDNRAEDYKYIQPVIIRDFDKDIMSARILCKNSNDILVISNNLINSLNKYNVYINTSSTLHSFECLCRENGKCEKTLLWSK